MTAFWNLIEKRSSGDTLINQLIGSRFSGTPNVTGFNALRHSAVFACTNLISDGVSTLPVDCYIRKNGRPEEIDLPEVIRDPSDFMSDVDWRRQRLMSWLTEGNAYGLITARDNRFMPRKIELLDPYSVAVTENKDTLRLEYRVSGKLVDPDSIVHWPGLLLPGARVGVSPITYAAAQITMGLYAQKFGQEYFIKGVKLNGVLNIKGVKQGSNEQAEEVKQRFIHNAQDANEPVVLFGDTTFTPLSISAADTRFLESSNASGQDIARFYGVAAEFIGLDSGSSMTYSNIESRSLHLQKYTFNPWIVRQEKADLKLVGSPAYVKVNRDAALAIDTLTRYQAHDIAIRSGLETRNERRELEDRPPIDGGNETLWPPYATNVVANNEGQQ